MDSYREGQETRIGVYVAPGDIRKILFAWRSRPFMRPICHGHFFCIGRARIWRQVPCDFNLG